MENRFIVSPFFLDEPLPELKSLAEVDWVVNTPTLSGGHQQARMSVIHQHPLLNGPLYVHFDTDILNLTEAPAQSYPAPGGPSSSILEAVFRRLANSGQVTAVSMTTWNPRLDKDGGSRRVCMALLETLVGTKD